MDEYLSEKEQIERLRELWRENGWFIIAGVLLGIAGIFGWSQYQRYRTHHYEQAAALYQQLKDAEDKKEGDPAALLARLRQDYPSSPYTDQAGLLVASSELVTEPSKASDELRYVMEHTKDPELALIARLRLARVLAYRQQYDDALNLLAVDMPGKFAGRYNEVKGDIEVALGHLDTARTDYLAAMVADGSELLDRNLLQMKLNDLPAPAAAATEKPAEPPAPAGAEQGGAKPPAPGNGSGDGA